MKAAIFSMAMMSAAIVAKSDMNQESRAEQKKEREFMAFVASESKNYSNVAELSKRKDLFKKSEESVARLNRQNKGVTFKINRFADMTDEEKDAMKNQMLEQMELEKTSEVSESKTSKKGSGRKLSSTYFGDRSISWVERGKVLPPKWQGYCGSCWSFVATTIMESAHAIKNDVEPIRLSEQEGVDCVMDGRYGCIGGWPSDYWRWAADNGGFRPYEDYPYEFVQGSCRKQENKVGYAWPERSTISEFYHFPRQDQSREEVFGSIMEQLEKGPLSIGVNYANDCFINYQSGIITSENSCQQYATSIDQFPIDHVMVIVGFHDGGALSTGQASDEVEYNRTCRWATKAEILAAECASNENQESFAPNRFGDENRKCCSYEAMEPIYNSTRDWDNSYWIVQNSFGTGWGDGGFMHMAVEAGIGPFGLNKAILGVEAIKIGGAA